MGFSFLVLLLSMASSSDKSKMDYSTPPSTSSSSSPSLPSPSKEPKNKWYNYRTGSTLEKKKSKRASIISPNTKDKIDEIHHYQQQQMDLQRELYFEQKVTARRISFSEQIAATFCSTKAKDVHEPMQVPCSSLDPSASYITPWDLPPRNYASSSWTPWDQTPPRPQISPNTLTQANVWSPLVPYNDANNQEKLKTPKKSSSSKKK